MTTEQRLARLERENRWMRRIGAVGLALVAAVFLMGQEKAKDLPDLEVRSLTVKDKDGKVRAVLGTDADGPALKLSDEDGRTRAALDVLDGEPSLTLKDKDGKAGALLFTAADGSPGLARKPTAPRTWSSRTRAARYAPGSRSTTARRAYAFSTPRAPCSGRRRGRSRGARVGPVADGGRHPLSEAGASASLGARRRGHA
jgi:hypothetical protein